MLFRLARRFSIPSTKFFLLLTGASAIFTYLVSPMRDPDFGTPKYFNKVSPHWWLEGVHEDHWTLAALILAGMLAISLTLDLWHLCKLGILATHRHRAWIPSWTEQLRDYFWIGMLLFVAGIVMWVLLSCVFVLYLAMQWLVD